MSCALSWEIPVRKQTDKGRNDDRCRGQRGRDAMMGAFMVFMGLMK